MFVENMPITECTTSDAASHLAHTNLTAKTSLGMVGMVDLLRLQGGNIARISELDAAKSNRFDIEVAKKVHSHGKMNQTKAIEYCAERNATLPLPVSLLEFEGFSNFSRSHWYDPIDSVWIGISDPSRSGNKDSWRDVNNKQPAFVKSMV